MKKRYHSQVISCTSRGRLLPAFLFEKIIKNIFIKLLQETKIRFIFVLSITQKK